MAAKLASNPVSLNVEYDDRAIQLDSVVSASMDASIIRSNRCGLTRPDASRSPLRLNRRQVACPEPETGQTQCEGGLGNHVIVRILPVKASG